MKNIFILLLLLSVLSGSVGAQSTDSLSLRIADRMRDSLSLRTGQRDSLYTINVLLQQQKLAVRSAYSDMDTLRHRFQGIENTRDSLYRPVLGEAYPLYKQKKIHLINNN